MHTRCRTEFVGAQGPEDGWDRGGCEWLCGILFPQVEKGIAGP